MVRFVSMTEDEYQQFTDWILEDYALEQVKAGVWHPEKAKALARQTFEAFLPEGRVSPGHRLCMIEKNEDEQKVGYIWFGVREEGESRFVVLYYFLIFEKHRRRGYGSEALKVLEEEVRSMGEEKIVLQVFGHNKAARALYQKMGYVERTVRMSRQL